MAHNGIPGLIWRYQSIWRLIITVMSYQTGLFLFHVCFSYCFIMLFFKHLYYDVVKNVSTGNPAWIMLYRKTRNSSQILTLLSRDNAISARPIFTSINCKYMLDYYRLNTTFSTSFWLSLIDPYQPVASTWADIEVSGDNKVRICFRRQCLCFMYVFFRQCCCFTVSYMFSLDSVPFSRMF
jgi:hypothetical protein